MAQPLATALDQARTDYLAGNLETALKILEGVEDPAPAVRALIALGRVRQVLSDHSAGTALDDSAWGEPLEFAWDLPDLEAHREFARGWLAWLAGASDRAESLLAVAAERFQALDRKEASMECAYWLARVRVSLHRCGALADFETGMRRWGGSPQLTCWYVDLLWRDGQKERAAQVWQTVRGNPRVGSVDEAPLLEARLLLWQGKHEAAEQVLIEARCRGGVVQVERQLLLAWLLCARKQIALADGWLRQAEAGPYPAAVLRAWRALFNLRHGILPGTNVPWLLHHAAQAQVRHESGQAVRWLAQARRADPEWKAAGPHAESVRRALPELERLALAQALGRAVRFSPHQPPLAGEVLDDVVRLLRNDARGQAVLAGLAQGNGAAVRQRLESLAGQDDLPPGLVYHLALIFHRGACYGETPEQTEGVERCWRLAWRLWIGVLGSLMAAGRLVEGRTLLARLLDTHRECISDYLSRNLVDGARRHWEYVESLSGLAPAQAPALTEELADSVARFRDRLTTDYLIATREAMKSGDIPAGWRADYDRGLGYVKRLLSLDGGNVRLLTALVEICGDWFLDCYNNEDARTLWQQVARFTPFALKLARLVEQRPGDLAARAALAEFCKYRGFIAADRREKIALYREAARFDPANENVQMLLAEITKS